MITWLLISSTGCTVDESERSVALSLNVSSWPIRLVDTTRIDHGHAWSGITAMTRESDGALLLADVGVNAVLRLDSSGAPRPVHGRRGFGPAEYQYIKWVGRCDEFTVAIYDPAREQLSLLSNDLKVEQVYPVPTPVRYQDVAGCLADRRILFAAEPGRIVSFGAQQVPLVAVSWDPAAGTLDTIAQLPGRDVFVSERHEATISMPFGRRSFVSVSRGSVLSARNDSDSVWIVTDETGPRAVVLQSLPQGARPDADAHRRAEAEVVAQFPALRDRKSAELVFSEMPKAKRYPRFSQFVADEIDGLWVGLPSTGASRTWLHYDELGRPRFRIELPEAFALQIARGDQLVGFTRTPNGEERVLSVSVLPP